MSVSQVPTAKDDPRRRKKYTHCLVCNAETATSEWPPMYIKVVRKITIKEGPGCLKCFKTWVAGNFLITHQHVGDFWEFCIWVATEPKEKEAFMKATEVRS